MREILFRAKRIDNGEWVEGNLITNERNDRKKYIGYIFDERNGVIEDFDIVEVMPNTICQYTGLKDKNGNRIWEKDILQNARNNDLYAVKWHGSFGMYVWSKRKENNKHIFDYGDLYLMNRKCVVIGNIFDNPELLKGE